MLTRLLFIAFEIPFIIKEYYYYFFSKPQQIEYNDDTFNILETTPESSIENEYDYNYNKF
jgi:hypothetical protein